MQLVSFDLLRVVALLKLKKNAYMLLILCVTANFTSKG